SPRGRPDRMGTDLRGLPRLGGSGPHPRAPVADAEPHAAGRHPAATRPPGAVRAVALGGLAPVHPRMGFLPAGATARSAISRRERGPEPGPDVATSHRSADRVLRPLPRHAGVLSPPPASRRPRHGE